VKVGGNLDNGFGGGISFGIFWNIFVEKVGEGKKGM